MTNEEIRLIVLKKSSTVLSDKEIKRIFKGFEGTEQDVMNWYESKKNVSVITLRVSANEYETIKKRASERFMSVNSYIRMCLKDEITRATK